MVDLPTPTVPSYLVCPVVVVIQLGLPQAFKCMKTQNMHDPASSLQLPFSRTFSVCHDMQSWAKELTLTYGDVTIWTVCVWLPVTVEGSPWCFSHPHNSSCVLLLDSLLLMWQPRCHRTIAPRWKVQRCWCWNLITYLLNVAKRDNWLYVKMSRVQSRPRQSHFDGCGMLEAHVLGDVSAR